MIGDLFALSNEFSVVSAKSAEREICEKAFRKILFPRLTKSKRNGKNERYKCRNFDSKRKRLVAKICRPIIKRALDGKLDPPEYNCNHLPHERFQFLEKTFPAMLVICVYQIEQ